MGLPSSQPPPSLADLQGAFWALVTAPSGVRPALDDPANAAHAAVFRRAFVSDTAFPREARLELYAQMYFYRILEALEGDYPAVREAVGPSRFHNLVTDYLLAHPSTHPSLRNVGRHLPGFVAGHALSGPRPYLADLAALELARTDAFDARDAEPLGVAALGGIPPARWHETTVAAHPTVRLVDASWAVADSWRRLIAGEETPVPEHRPQRLVVWRRRHRVLHRAGSAAEAEALTDLLAGTTLAALCERLAAHADAEESAPQAAVALLVGWLEDGLVVFP